MTKYIFIFFMSITFQLSAQYHETHDSTKNIIISKDIYQGKNLYVQNNPCDCTDSIFINGKRYTHNFDVSAYEIPLDSFVTVIGTPYKILIYHNEFCEPKFLIAGWGIFRSRVRFTSFDINAHGKVHFETINSVEGQRTDLQISQLRGFKWTTVLYIPQKKGIKNSYDTVVTLMPGINTFRISSYKNQRNLYLDATVNSGIPPIAYRLDTDMQYVEFADYVYYMIQTSNKATILRGYDNRINISTLRNGSYILLYENEECSFEITQRK